MVRNYISISFSFEKYNGREVTTHKDEAWLDFDEGTLSSYAEFEKVAKRIYRKAIKCIKDGDCFYLTIMQKHTSKFSDDSTLDKWNAAEVWEQSADDNYIYFRPDTTYTQEWRDMVWNGSLSSLGETLY